MSSIENETNNPDPNDDGLTEEEREFAKGFAGDEAETPAGAGSDEGDEGGEGGDEGTPAATGDAGGDDGAQGVDNPEGGAQPDSQDDWLDSLPEEVRNRVKAQSDENRTLREELAQQRNDNAAMAGKIAPLQRQLAQLTNQRAASPAKAPASDPGSNPKPAATPDTPETAEELAALEETPEFKEWADAFPEEAKVWRANQQQILKAAEKIAQKQVGAVRREFEERFGPVVSSFEQQQRAAEREKRVAELAAAHPDWEQHSASDAFSDWFNDQYIPSLPGYMQERYKDEAKVIEDLRDPKFAIRVLTEFKRDTGLTNANPNPESTPAPEPAPAASGGAPAKAPAKSSRLALASSPSVSQDPVSTRVPIEAMDAEQAFLAGFNSSD